MIVSVFVDDDAVVAVLHVYVCVRQIGNSRVPCARARVFVPVGGCATGFCHFCGRLRSWKIYCSTFRLDSCGAGGQMSAGIVVQ